MATSEAQEIKKQKTLVRFSIISYKTRLLVVDNTCRSYEGHEIKHQKNPWEMGTFINTSKKVSIFTFGSIFTNKILCDLVHGINTNETWKTSVTRHRGLKFEEVTNFPLTLSPLWTRIIYGKYVIWVVQFPMKRYKIIYSRVHISSDTAFLKILKKPFIVQE